MLWATGYDAARAFVEVEHRGKIIKAWWTEPNKTQHVLKQPVDESMRGGFTVRITQVRENRAYLTSRRVDVPWTNKNLTVKWERFVSKLEPGQKETYAAIVTGPDAARPSPRWWPGCTTRRSTRSCHTTGWSGSACSARTTRGSA